MVKFRTNIYGYNKSDVASFVKEVASEYESIYEKREKKLMYWKTENAAEVDFIIYNDDGIEESIGVEQNVENGKYFSKARRKKS